MTVHRPDTTKTDSKRVKSKIILPSKQHTKPLPKKKKTIRNNKKVEKFTTTFYIKIKFNTVLNSLKIKNISTNRYKVHSTHKKTFNKA